ncbi:hypothetical protein [Capnocytophaga sputigena]|uniref:hypothetical protein n=1 Tax=Capnocytophaga sputigena TaxID=1019 RepID=UPI0028D6D769|nr:hypothetical protein [Capnocytophaga sputigena]
MPKLPAYTARIFGKVFYPPIAPTIARAARTSHNSYFSPPLSPSHFANSLIIPTFALCKEYSP